ncbi:class III signal peptide-containing protein [Thermococcus sp. MAR1]|uniref:class III signal peptide-containing protein n=1 Tax=Thermococcus sp. MAR1 TaxID=1638263 RepID=UPI0037437C3C
MRGKSGQGSIEYLFMIALALLMVLLVIKALSSITTPYTAILTLSPGSMESQVEDVGSFKVEAWLEDNRDGTYKVYYRIWALKRPLTKANVELVCFGNTEHVGGLGPIQHSTLLEPVNYWANYWTPVPQDAFPCQVQATVWKKGIW